MQTPRRTVHSFIKIEGGEYWHQGLEVCLRNYFSNLNKSMLISLNINIDGVRIFRSSKSEFWPILFNIFEIPEFQPMVIGVFYGTSKPKKIEEFLKPFVDEIISILNNGIEINSHMLTVKIRCFICDTPARSFIKETVYFNSKHGCLKCTTIGEFSHTSNTTVFHNQSAPPRTDQGFRARIYGFHHNNYKTKTPDGPIFRTKIEPIISPLLRIKSLDMIKDIIVADPLHILHLGIVKRYLVGFQDGSLGYGTKWDSKTIYIINEKLLKIKLPEEIHRSVRGIDVLNRKVNYYCKEDGGTDG